MQLTKKDIWSSNHIILNRLYNYCLLNGSFNDNTGLGNGKSGWAFFLFHYASLNQSAYQNNIAFSLLEEIIEQINEKAPMNFTDGITGFGSMIDYLHIQGYLEQDSASVLEDIEPEILKMVYLGNFDSLDVSDGAAGFGIYFYYRLVANNFTEPLLKARITEALILIVDILQKNVNDVICKDYFSIIEFLRKVESLNIYNPTVSKIVNSYKKKWESNAAKESTSYYLYLLQNKNTTYEEEIINLIKKLLLQPIAANISRVAFYLCVLKAYSRSSGVKCSEMDIDALLVSLNHQIQKNSLDVLFPFNETTKSIDTGLRFGVGCLAMSYISIITNDFSWLNMFCSYE